MSSRNGSFILTYTGKKMYPFDPRPEEICIEDIAHALSNLCRFTGHCNEFYSVAQHSVYVSVHVDKKYAMCGLLHDAAEAYMNDIARPVKKDIRMKLYLKAEKYLMHFILARFGVYTTEALPKEVVDIDNKMLSTEARDLGLKKIMDTIIDPPFSTIIRPQSPKDAKTSFLEWFETISEW